MLKMIFVLYIGFAFLLSVLGIFQKDTDKDGYFERPWLFIIGLTLILITPIVAKICELI